MPSVQPRLICLGLISAPFDKVVEYFEHELNRIGVGQRFVAARVGAIDWGTFYEAGGQQYDLGRESGDRSNVH